MRMDLAWKKYHRDWFFSRNCDEERPEQRVIRAANELAPCRGKIDGTYLPSELAKRHGFDELELFFKAVSGALGNGENVPPPACFDSLLSLASACRRKLPKVKRSGKLNVQRARLRPFCKSCGRQTELASYFQTKMPHPLDSKEELRLSSQFCNVHRPKAPFFDTIQPEYQRAKRSQTKFDVELSRLERQVRGQYSCLPQRTWAQSGNALIDEFFHCLVDRHLGNANPEDPILRDFARDLVDQKITDRKKEIVALLAAKRSQTEVAAQLGVSRQLVSRALFKIPEEYRFDVN